jgi:hypothetical protein
MKIRNAPASEGGRYKCDLRKGIDRAEMGRPPRRTAPLQKQEFNRDSRISNGTRHPKTKAPEPSLGHSSCYFNLWVEKVYAFGRRALIKNEWTIPGLPASDPKKGCITALEKIAYFAGLRNE